MPLNIMPHSRSLLLPTPATAAPLTRTCFTFLRRFHQRDNCENYRLIVKKIAKQACLFTMMYRVIVQNGLFTPWMSCYHQKKPYCVSFLLKVETDELMMGPDMYLELGAGGHWQWSVEWWNRGQYGHWPAPRVSGSGHSDASHPVSTCCITTL